MDAIIQKLWEDFGNTPIDDEDCIEQSWNDFPKGTSRFDIWHWFENTFNISVAKDLMKI